MNRENKSERVQSLRCQCSENWNDRSYISKPSTFIIWKTTRVACWRCSLRELFLCIFFLFLCNYFLCVLRKVPIRDRDLKKVVSAALLKSLFVMDDFLKIFQEFNKNSFNTRSPAEELLLKFASNADILVEEVKCFLIIVTLI